MIFRNVTLPFASSGFLICQGDFKDVPLVPLAVNNKKLPEKVSSVQEL